LLVEDASPADERLTDAPLAYARARHAGAAARYAGQRIVDNTWRANLFRDVWLDGRSRDGQNSHRENDTRIRRMTAQQA
jgi:hypothetical protein